MTDDWRPTAPLDNLKARARLATEVRRFFAERDVLEVETPALATATVTDLHLHSLDTRLELPGGERRLWLQTSPEFHMKRLLAAGSGSIFQLARAFRDGEAGSRHNPEFTLLEWYRVGFDHHRLMDEVEELLRLLLPVEDTVRTTWGELFEQHLGFDPHRTATPKILETARERTGVVGLDAEHDRDAALQLLMSRVVEPGFPERRVTFVHDFPASQAALARLRRSAPDLEVAERFEVWVGPIELANGFHELADADEQRRRFERDRAERRRRGLPEPPIDEHLLAALAHGLPDCAGVALGFDRLVMLATGARSIEEVLAFPVARA